MTPTEAIDSARLRATVLDCTLKPSPERSNTEQLADPVIAALQSADVDVTSFRVVDHQVPPGVETGNVDGAHHVIAEVVQGLVDIGYTVPGQAWTYWNRGPGPGPTFAETDEGHEWSIKTGQTMAANLAATARALLQHPLPT